MSGTEKKSPSRQEEEKLDETVEESFPASDPASHTGVTGPVVDPIEDLPPEEREKDTPHETIRDWRGTYPIDV
ncbi:hypothetical protein MVG78_00870 [Roseomonas gilardii subsp. gilardii]|uniref:hypothetical protein n=1 Tax=Roseomonas gilardii TaxID=257708 RepID=UPI001FFB9DD5|nr:hypothetical protein [Roseomonas gilardii]UPG72788.1 hypothetical protein MVG78_00870 [Roseomonas gilardii subsp. gilardii]